MGNDNTRPECCSYCYVELDEFMSMPDEELDRIENKLCDGIDLTDKESLALEGLCYKCYNAMNDQGEI